MPKATIVTPTVTAARSDDPIDRIATNLRTVLRAFSHARSHENLLKEAGVRLDRAGAALLYKLHQSPDEALRVGDLAERLAIDTPAVTRKIQQLERLGYVTAAPDLDDKRAKRVRLTRNGIRILERIMAANRRHLAAVFETWSARDLREFDTALDRLAVTLTREMENPL